MRTQFKAALAAACVSVAAASGASASILASVAPNGPFQAIVQDDANQNFLVQFTLAANSTIDGFGIYVPGVYSGLGTAVTIKVRSDVSGSPDTTNLFSFNDTIDTSTGGNNQFLISAHFSPLALSAGTYWMGMSGVSTIGWESFNYGVPAPSTQRQLFQDFIVQTPSIGSLAFQVEGSTGGVPEPASWGLMILGLGGVGATLRRRSRMAAA